jgi:hypothetical protein
MDFIEKMSVKATAADTDKDTLSWNLSWHPEGRCDRFTREAILACAPLSSGVYGLFNFDCQIFIGESENIQEALLRHESETDFQSRHLRPTGFTFEACADELRRTKANELITRFHPVLQKEATLTETRSSPNGPKVNEAGRGEPVQEAYGDHREFPLHESELRPTVRRRSHVTRTRGASWAALLVAIAAAIYLSTSANRNIQGRANGADANIPARNSITQLLAAGWSWTGLGPQSASSTEAAGGPASQRIEPITGSPDVPTPALISNVAMHSAAPGAPAEDRTGIRAISGTRAHPAASANLSNKWSVQISAAPAKEIADALAQRLKADGHDAYVVPAEVKGTTYYRVRVGPFATRDKAESTHRSLAQQKGYPDAFLTGD